MTSAPGDKWLAGDAYEGFMGRWSRPLARVFLEWLRPPPSAHWLDVGCGTGALTSSICEVCEPASVVACDPSGPFVEHARKNLAIGHASFVVAGADDLPRREGGFDAIASGLVLNFLPDPARAVAYIRERLRAGGIAAAYVWDYAGGMEFLRCFWEEAVASDPGAAAFDERRRFPLSRRSELEALFRAAGLEQVETGAVEIPTDFVDFEDYWAPFLRGTGPAPAYVTLLAPSSRDLLKERLRRRLQGGIDQPIQLRARAWAVRGSSR